jgi:uncharacterized damage-inducible protein DinB
MTSDGARELFGYSAWANGRIFGAAEALTAEQASATIASSFPSILGTLGHIVGTEWIWLRRWLGEAPTAAPGWLAESESRTPAGAERSRRASGCDGGEVTAAGARIGAGRNLESTHCPLTTSGFRI